MPAAAPSDPAAKPTAPEPSAPAAVEASAADLGAPILTSGLWSGEDYFEGRFDSLIPLFGWSGQDGVLLADLRAAFADEGEEEANLGLVVRQRCLPGGGIAGANLFYDSRWTKNEAHFNQLGLGLEALTEWVDARVNLYLPETDREWVGSQTESTLVSQVDRTSFTQYAQDHEIYERWRTTRTQVWQHSTYDLYEVPLEGYDAEFGVKLPFGWKDVEARIFLGYYDFEPKTGGSLGSPDDASGVKGRIEVRAWDRLFADAEVFENDDLFGSDYLLSVRLRVPLERSGLKALRGDFGGWSEEFPNGRMNEMVMRDPHIQVRSAVDVQQETETVGEVLGSGRTLLLSDVIFVHGDRGGPLEDGSSDHPFDRVQEGVDQSSASGIPNVYVYGASNPYRENIVIGNGVNLYGEGHRFGHGGTPGNGTTPVLEGQLGDGLLMPGVVSVVAVPNPVLLSGFEVTAAPFAGGPWQSPFVSGSLPPLSGVFVMDSPSVTIQNNTFRNLVAGVAAYYESVPTFDLTVQDNLFRDVGLGVGAAFMTGGHAVIQDNVIERSLLGVAVAGWGNANRATADITGNWIGGTPFDLAQAMPYAVFEELLTMVLPVFPTDHPESLPIPSLGGILAVAGPQANLGVNVIGNTVIHPLVGVAGVAISPNVLGGNLPFDDAKTVLDMTVRDNVLQGGGIDPIYQLARNHAGTIAALLGFYDGPVNPGDPETVEEAGDLIRAFLPESLGFDAGLAGVLLASAGEGAVMDNAVVANNQVSGYLLGVASVAAGDGRMRDLRIADNQLEDNLLGILGAAVLGGDMQRVQIVGNTVQTRGLGYLNGLMEALDVGDILGIGAIPDWGVLGIGLVGYGDASLGQFRIDGNTVGNALVGIAAVGIDADLGQGHIGGNTILHSPIGIVGAGLGSQTLMDDLVVEDNQLAGGDRFSLVGLGLIGYDGASMDRFDICGNQVQGHSLSVATLALDGASLNDGQIRDNTLSDHLVGIAGVNFDSQMNGLAVTGNSLSGSQTGILGEVLDNILPDWFAQDTGVAGVALVVADEGSMTDAEVSGNILSDHVLGVLGYADGDGADISRLDIHDNALTDNALGILVSGQNGANLADVDIHANQIDGSVVGVLAHAGRDDATEARTAMSVNVRDNDITGSDALLPGALVGMGLLAVVEDDLPLDILGLNDLAGNNPADLLTVFEGLGSVVDFDPSNPPALEDVIEDPDFAQLLGGKGLAGVMVSYRDGQAGQSSALIEGNVIGNMENGIYAVAVDSQNQAVVDLQAKFNTSADNVVIGEDTSRADYTLDESGANQEAFVELPTL